MLKQEKHLEDQTPKADEKKRVVTLTLPERTLNVLETYDTDLSQAIVKATELAGKKAFPTGNSFEVVRVAPGKSVFVVGSQTRLTEIPWLKLVEIAPGRNLIAIPSGMSLESLEVAILELIDSTPPDRSMERMLLEAFEKYVGRLRRYKKMSRAEILIVDTDD